MKNPFVIDCTRFTKGVLDVEHRTQTGACPENIGLEMISFPQGAEVTLEVDLAPLGEGINATGTVTGVARAQCSCCLTEHEIETELPFSQIFALTDTFITTHGEPDDESDEELEDIPRVENNFMDLTQVIIDEAGTTFPFNPTCDSLTGDPCPEDAAVPEADDPEELIDPRWAGLAKFKK